MEQNDASFWLEDHSTERAFTHLRPVLLALEKDDLLKVNLDVSAMAVGILTRMPKLRSLPTQLARKYPECSPQQFDKLEEYARCLLHTHALYLNMGRGTDTPPRLLKKARDLRAVLTTESPRACCARSPRFEGVGAARPRRRLPPSRKRPSPAGQSAQDRVAPDPPQVRDAATRSRQRRKARVAPPTRARSPR